jgi:hypothetical protein
MPKCGALFVVIHKSVEQNAVALSMSVKAIYGMGVLIVALICTSPNS